LVVDLRPPLLETRRHVAASARVGSIWRKSGPPNGTSSYYRYVLPANSRTTIPIALDFPESAAQRVAVMVQGVDTTPLAPLVVERSIYWDAGGVTWAAGTYVVGTPIP
jgi:hypothetical protein